MFFFMIGITEGVRHLLYDKTVYCRDCGCRTRVRIAMTYTCFSLFLIPLFKWNRHFYVEFACCKRHYELNPAIGMRILRGEAPDIAPEDLLPVEEDPSPAEAVRRAAAAKEARTAEARATQTAEETGFAAQKPLADRQQTWQSAKAANEPRQRQFIAPQEEDRSGKRFCPHCGEEIDPRMDDCPHCGGKL